MKERRVLLSELVESEGFEFKVEANLRELRGGLGTWFEDMIARAYKASRLKFGVACKGDDLHYAYSASHEIAEVRHKWVHSSEMFCEQANILAKWVSLAGLRFELPKTRKEVNGRPKTTRVRKPTRPTGKDGKPRVRSRAVVGHKLQTRGA